MKAIMYHYVRSFNQKNPNFRFLDFNNFKSQLDFFEQKYGFVKKEDWEDLVLSKNQNTLPKGVILTFDDAMACHYQFVFPELKKRNLWGIFFVPTAPYTNNLILDVHKIHILLGRYDPMDLLEICQSIITEKKFEFEKKEDYEKLTYKNHTHSEVTNHFKRILNYFLTEENKSSVIELISKELNCDFSHENYYVSVDQLKEMKNYDMVIGSHSHTHPLMSKLSKKKQMDELNTSFNFLENEIGISYRTYCHPYGGFHSFNNETLQLLEKIGVKYSFNVESKDISLKDLRLNSQMIPRYDCNEFLHGGIS
tara:strand:- start:41806 stop:42732 length:927 start_codon:yes stop_codon:yes gene_type:complete